MESEMIKVGNTEASKDVFTGEDSKPQAKGASEQLGGDENPKKNYRFFEREWGPIRIVINPVIFCLSSAVIWTFVIICCVSPVEAGSAFGAAKSGITAKFTWL